MDPTPLVRLESVGFAHGRGPEAFRLFVDALTVARGEHLAVVGPSGCGKTTLLHLMTGVLTPATGRVRFDGLALESMGESARRDLRVRRMGMVFQELGLLDYLDGLENLLVPLRAGGLRVTRASRRRALELARGLGIEGRLRRRPSRLSQGERQRLAICRALMNEPDLLACDEPTGNLDPARAAETIELLQAQARARGAAVVVITHDHSLLDRFDRVLDATSLAAGAPA